MAKFRIVMSDLIARTAEAKENVIKNAYANILDVLEDKVQEAEILPGNILKLVVDENSADDFSAAMKDIGSSEVIRLKASRLWRSGCADVINVEFDRLDDIDFQWNTVIDELEARAGIN